MPKPNTKVVKNKIKISIHTKSAKFNQEMNLELVKTGVTLTGRVPYLSNSKRLMLLSVKSFLCLVPHIKSFQSLHP